MIYTINFIIATIKLINQIILTDIFVYTYIVVINKSLPVRGSDDLILIG